MPHHAQNMPRQPPLVQVSAKQPSNSAKATAHLGHCATKEMRCWVDKTGLIISLCAALGERNGTHRTLR